MKIGRWLWVVLAIMLLCQSALASEVNLQERFSGPALEYDGKTYYMKNRVSTVLAMGFNPGKEGSTGFPELILLLVVDDGAKTMLPLQFDPSTLVNWEYEGGKSEASLTLRELFDAQQDVETGCLRMMDALNGLLPQDVLESYVALNLDGLTVIDGIPNDATNTVGDALLERLRGVMEIAEKDDDPSGLLGKMGDYLVSNMKSGALLKVMDKAERFDVQPRTMPSPLDGTETVEIDTKALKDMLVGVYCEEEKK